MKHAREDYNRIQDPAGLIPEDEPVILLRGQDKLAPLVLRYYAMLCRRAKADDAADLIDAQVDLMLKWHKRKIPDLPTKLVCGGEGVGYYAQANMEQCPTCKQLTVRAEKWNMGGGGECMNPDCDYWLGG